MDAVIRSTNSTPTSSGVACCAVLSVLFGSEISFPGSTTYNTSQSTYYSQQEETVYPTCVFVPETSENVSLAVSSLAASPGCQFAIRSGGHTMNAGAANIQNGVTIDLSALDAVTVSDDGQNVVSIGPGATWDQVYATLEAEGLAVTGGRSEGVGVGGLSLGGGLSWFSPRYGWTFDSILNYEIVLANGTVVNAQDDDDLLIALRGGSNNFGIVTRVDIQGFEQGLLWGGFLYTPVSTIDDHIEQFVKFSNQDDYDVYASMDMAISYTAADGLLIVNQPVYTKPMEDPEVYADLLSLPQISSTLRIANLTSLAAETASLQATGLRSNYHAITLVSTTEVMNASWAAFNASVPLVSGVTDIAWSIVFEPLPPAIYARHASENSLGLKTRNGPLIIVLIMAAWTDEADDATVYGATASLAAEIKTAATALGAWDPFEYLNYADQSQQPIASYGSDSVARLRSVRDQVDPKKVFTKQVPGGFKIPS